MPVGQVEYYDLAVQILGNNIRSIDRIPFTVSQASATQIWSVSVDCPHNAVHSGIPNRSHAGEIVMPFPPLGNSRIASGLRDPDLGRN